MPSSWVVGRISSSGSRVHSEYSVCSAAMGCTLLARRMVGAEGSDNPRWRTLPARTSSAMAPTVFFDGDLGIDAMLVVEVDRIDAEALQAGVAGGTHIRGASVEAARVRIGLAAHDAKFCGD